MSTRSGKRIHALIHENSVDEVIEFGNKRKSRNKNLKTGGEYQLTEKKRKHYVTYPLDEDMTESTVSNCDNILKVTKSNNMLKERNVLSNDVDILNNDKIITRQTRRTKKIQTADCTENAEPSDMIKETKKNKPSSFINENTDLLNQTTTATKKLSKKKKSKKKTSSIVYDITENSSSNINKSNVSADSFHSAAGSSEKYDEKNCKNIDQISAKIIKKNKTDLNDYEIRTSSINTIESDSTSILGDKNLIYNIPVITMSGKEITNTNNKINSFSRIDHNSDKKVRSNRNASISGKKKDATFEIESNNASLSDKIKHDDTTSFKSVSGNSSKKRRKTNIGIENDELCVNQLNTTFDKDEHSFEYEVSQNDLKCLKNVKSLGKSRNSNFKYSTSNKPENRGNNLDVTYEKESSFIKIDSKQEECPSNLKIKELRKSKRISTEEHSDLTETITKTENKLTIETLLRSKNSTFDKSLKLDMTIGRNDKSFDKTLQKNISARSSLLSLDITDNISSDKSVDNFCINITSDDSNCGNIDNTIPILIDSTDNSEINDSLQLSTNNSTCLQSNNSIRSSNKDSPLKSEIVKTNSTTPLKREGTYTQLQVSTPKNLEIKEIKSTNLPILNDRDQVGKTSIVSLQREATYTEIPYKNTELKQDETYTNVNTPTRVKNLPKSPEGTHSTTLGNNDAMSCVRQSTQTRLTREGTFTKDSTDVIVTPKQETSLNIDRGKSLQSPGCTPFPTTKSSSKTSVLNVTHSIEKSSKKSIDLLPRATKVMFCSPVNNAEVMTQMKKKVIKSSLKGSNKSFIFDESVSATESRPRRKRSYTQSEAESIIVKRKRLTEDQRNSVERLSRPRTISASAVSSVCKPDLTPSKHKPDVKLSRTKLPNFAALHQKQFAKMESLDECQERKAKRARQLLTPTGAITITEKTSPKDTQHESLPAQIPTKKTETPRKSKPTGDHRFTRFGFKLNKDVNPFSFPAKSTENNIKENIVKPLQRYATQPSLVGATTLRKNAAKQTVMREKSFVEKRDVNRKENRTVIKGVRTNRRFELQMKMRNIES